LDLDKLLLSFIISFYIFFKRILYITLPIKLYFMGISFYILIFRPHYFTNKEWMNFTDMVCSTIEIIIITYILLYTIRLLLSHTAAWHYFFTCKTSCRPHEYTPDVSLIIPVYGRGEEEYTNFINFCEQEYSGACEVLFCVENKSDPVIPEIRQIIQKYPGKRIRLVYSGLYSDVKGKIQNMIAGVNESMYNIIIFIDADVHVSPSFINDSVKPMENTSTGLAFSAPVAEGARRWPAAFVNILVNDTVLNYTPYFLTKEFKKANGAVMVTRKDVLDGIGGLQQFGSSVGIDVKISSAVCGKGYTIHLLPQPARMVHHDDTVSGAWGRVHRWMVTLKHYAPAGVFIASLFDIPFFWCILYTTAALFTPCSLQTGIFLTLWTLALQAGSRILLNIFLVKDKKFWKFLWIICFLDFLRFGLLVHSYLSNKVIWGGRVIRVRDKNDITYI
jgi:ceramide glucosyltransferase